MGFMLVASLAVYQMSSAWFLGHLEVGPTGRSVLATVTIGLLLLTCLLTVRSGGLFSQYAHEYASSDQDGALRSSSRCGVRGRGRGGGAAGKLGALPAFVSWDCSPCGCVHVAGACLLECGGSRGAGAAAVHLPSAWAGQGR